MAKEKFTCTHCGKVVEWYRSFIDEIGFAQIDDKWYCEGCLKKLGHVAMDV